MPGSPDYVFAPTTRRKTGEAALPIGRGSAGAVYKVTYKERLERAVKILLPDEDADEQGRLGFDDLASKFENEISLLTTLTHANIAKIVDFGRMELGESQHPYYVMDFVDGAPLSDWWGECSGEEFLDVLSQIVHALTYLHSRNYYHMDVKEKNILVQAGSAGQRAHAVILDLGGAKPVPTWSAATAGDTTYISTGIAVREERLQWLGKPTPRKLFVEWGADLDLFSIGSMLQRAIDTGPLARRLEGYLGKAGFRALQWSVSQLTDGTSTPRHYTQMAALSADVQRVRPDYAAPLGLTELNLAPGEESIQLPGQRIGLNTSLLEVINHPFVQRLGNIDQLEYVRLVYPGAKHSRLQHCLSAFQLTRRFLLQLLNHADFRMIATPSHVQAALLAVLLHDVGHYPLEHEFEDFTEDALRHSRSKSGREIEARRRTKISSRLS
jgi:hypothetical protein